MRLATIKKWGLRVNFQTLEMCVMGFGLTFQTVEKHVVSILYIRDGKEIVSGPWKQLRCGRLYFQPFRNIEEEGVLFSCGFRDGVH